MVRLAVPHNSTIPHQGTSHARGELFPEFRMSSENWSTSNPSEHGRTWQTSDNPRYINAYLVPLAIGLKHTKFRIRCTVSFKFPIGSRQHKRAVLDTRTIQRRGLLFPALWVPRGALLPSFSPIWALWPKLCSCEHCRKMGLYQAYLVDFCRPLALGVGQIPKPADPCLLSEREIKY